MNTTPTLTTQTSTAPAGSGPAGAGQSHLVRLTRRVDRVRGRIRHLVLGAPRIPVLWPIATSCCVVCSQAVEQGESCRNQLCDGERSITAISAVAAYGGDLRAGIRGLKYYRETGWAPVLGRLLLTHLDAHLRPEEVDLIVANPTYPTGDPDQVRHPELVLRECHRADQADQAGGAARWPINLDGVLIKTAPTTRSAGTPAAAKLGAAQQLYDVLAVPDPARVAGRRIVVVDDVCTTGAQLDVVARVLREHGAADVTAVVLARTQWAQLCPAGPRAALLPGLRARARQLVHRAACAESGRSGDEQCGRAAHRPGVAPHL